MAKRITIRPQTISRETALPIGSTAKRKVAAYARVSTDHEEQQTSYEAQCDYYTRYIKSRSDWEFVGIYADEGVTGTSATKREGFTRMVKDALDGRIDLILTKSVSRFARNTVDSLTTIRELKAHGTEVFFEKENIWTFDSKGELLISIMSSLSQEESRSISENVKWGHQKKFETGRFSLNYSQFLGYDKGEDGTLVINEEQAKIVRMIYGDFILGLSPTAIAKKLMEMGIPSPTGKEKWYKVTVKSILTNEKYKGCALLQKTYTPDFLTKKVVKNHGEVQQYYVEDSHPAIIPPEQFALVQEMLAERVNSQHRSGVTIFSGKIFCGCCGGLYGTKVWHSTDKYRKVVWQCNSKFENATRCTTPHLTEDDIKAAFLRLVNTMTEDRDFYLKELRKIMGKIGDTAELEEELRLLDEQVVVDAKAVNDLVARNARVALDQELFTKQYDALAERYEKTKAKQAEVTAKINDRIVRKNRIKRFIESLAKMTELFTEFDESLWAVMVNSITVYDDGKLVFHLTSGMDVDVGLD